MLATHRLLNFASGGTSTPRPDCRSTEAVFEAAAKRFRRAGEPASVQALLASGVEWSQQLVQLSEDDWDRAGISLGLKTAVKAELCDPSTSDQAVDHVQAVTVSKEMRQFLLLPGDDGTAAKPLSRASAFFLSLTATPVADRQNLLIALCELIAVVSGLSLPLSLEFRRLPTSSPDGMALAANEYHNTSVAVDDHVWSRPPSLADGMDAMATFLFLLNLWVSFYAVIGGLFIATAGWHADDGFCCGAVAMLAKLIFFVFMQGLIWPLMALMCWQGFTNATSPYPLIGGVVLFFSCYTGFTSVFISFTIEHMALEVYHMPRWLIEDFKMSLPWLRHRLTEKSLRGPAERRAGKLRAQMGL